MSTFMAKPAEVQRKWYIIDAAGKPLGRVAVKAADLLRGKVKPEFTPHVDCGDHVIIINCAQAVLTGKKLDQKKLQWVEKPAQAQADLRGRHRTAHCFPPGRGAWGLQGALL